MKQYFQQVDNWQDSPVPPDHQLCMTVQTGETPVTLAQRSPYAFAVVYGKQVTAELTYSEAAKELGECIMHSLACGGKLDNSGTD